MTNKLLLIMLTFAATPSFAIMPVVSCKISEVVGTFSAFPLQPEPGHLIKIDLNRQVLKNIELIDNQGNVVSTITGNTPFRQTEIKEQSAKYIATGFTTDLQIEIISVDGVLNYGHIYETSYPGTAGTESSITLYCNQN
jgi:hypothetical protein